jgi:hypothetical protein
MSTVATSIEVNVPVRTAYNQWTQFEEFPQFGSKWSRLPLCMNRSNHRDTRTDSSYADNRKRNRNK